MQQTDLLDQTSDDVIASGVSDISVQEARDLVKLFAEVTTSKNVDEFLSGFTDDSVVQYGKFPQMTGKGQFRSFVEQMFSPRLKDFVCTKSLRTLNGNVLGGTWNATWVDAKTGKAKAGRGFEFWIMRGNQQRNFSDASRKVCSWG